jgi:hypothetical protein
MPNQTNPDPLRGFDAVAESRRWKEAVARETQGMTAAERMAYFRRHSTVKAIAAPGTVRAAEEAACIVREEPPEQ